jgi:uncharacterized protein involved in type VI secretion and phage assembly
VIDADAGLERIVAGLVERIERRFYGKYRGIVVGNDDPERLGRLQLQVPSVLGRNVVTGWATPCVPYGGAADQGLLFLPDVGAGVWVEFEEGDLEFPVWTGAYWSKPDAESELPRPNDATGTEADDVQRPPTRKIIKTSRGHTLQFEDAKGAESVLLQDGAHGHLIVFDDTGITVLDGVNGHEVRLTGDGITINDGVHDGNAVTLGADGVTVRDNHDNAIVLGSGGIQIGGSAADALVLGTSLKQAVADFVASLNTHTHLGNLGAPTGPPAKPMKLDVPLSTKHTVE